MSQEAHNNTDAESSKAKSSSGNDAASPEPKSDSRVVLRVNKKLIGALLAALTAVAGFAVPEVRETICLDLPSSSALRYPSIDGSLKPEQLFFDEAKRSANGAQVVLQGRWAGFRPAVIDSYKTYWSPEVLGAVGALEESAPENAGVPAGFAQFSFPGVPLIFAGDALKTAEALPIGAVVAVRGSGTYVDRVQEGSVFAESFRKAGQLIPANQDLPSFASFYVSVMKIEALSPENHPKGRLMCRLMHSEEELAKLR